MNQQFYTPRPAHPVSDPAVAAKAMELHEAGLELRSAQRRFTLAKAAFDAERYDLQDQEAAV